MELKFEYKKAEALGAVIKIDHNCMIPDIAGRFNEGVIHLPNSFHLLCRQPRVHYFDDKEAGIRMIVPITRNLKNMDMILAYKDQILTNPGVHRFPDNTALLDIVVKDEPLLEILNEKYHASIEGYMANTEFEVVHICMLDASKFQELKDNLEKLTDEYTVLREVPLTTSPFVEELKRNRLIEKSEKELKRIKGLQSSEEIIEEALRNA